MLNMMSAGSIQYYEHMLIPQKNAAADHLNFDNEILPNIKAMC